MKIKFLLIILILTVLGSCGQEVEEEKTEFEQQSFFDVVYETTSARPIGELVWTKIDGSRDVKFDSNVILEDEDSIPSLIEGTFVFKLVNYTWLKSIEECSGTWDGKFDLSFVSVGSDNSNVISVEDVNYSILDPYNPNNGTDSIDPNDIIEEIRTYQFDLTVENVNLYPTVENVNLSPQETCSFPFTTHSLKIIRFPNGTLIMEDNSKGLEYFLRPKLRTER
jgi:hypothetical protein